MRSRMSTELFAGGRYEAPPRRLRSPCGWHAMAMHERADVDVVHRARCARHHVFGARNLKRLPLESLVHRTGSVCHPLGHLGRGCDVLEEGGGEEVARANAISARVPSAAAAATLGKRRGGLGSACRKRGRL